MAAVIHDGLKVGKAIEVAIDKTLADKLPETFSRLKHVLAKAGIAWKCRTVQASALAR